jgi:hypothetical protein
MAVAVALLAGVVALVGLCQSDWSERDDTDSAYDPGHCVMLSHSAALHWRNV